MREIVIVISDLYLAPGQSGGPSDLAGVPGTLAGLEHAARFGRRRSIAGEGGWRPWLARWLGLDDFANVAPAVVAAAAISTRDGALTASAEIAASAAPTDSAGADHGGIDARAATEPAIAIAAAAQTTGSTAWFATPVHLIAGLTSLHLDRRSILRLSQTDLDSFAQDFNRTFGATDLHLAPLANGEFLMRGPATLSASTTEPSRALAADLATALPKGSDSKSLKRLGAELEMWLHTHPLNEARQRRGELPVSALWLWGGGVSAQFNSLAGSIKTRGDLAFGSDPYLSGLWHLRAGQALALPNDKLAGLLADPHAQRAVLVTEVTPLLHANPHWTVIEALSELDRLFITPTVAALRKGLVESVVLIVNDTEVRVARRDSLKFWRRARHGLAGLLPA